MKRFWILCSFGYLALLNADTTTFSKDRLTNFFDAFLCEEKEVISEAGLTCCTCSYLSAFPTAPPADPPPNPSPPTPMTGLLPIVMVNNSGLPDNEVYVLVQGRVPIGGPQVFVQFDGAGVGTNHVVSTGENGSTYTYPLSYFPASSNGHVFYLEMIDSFLVLISLKSPLNIPVLATGIADPAFNNPNDPYGNYTINWDQVEGAYVTTTPNIAVDATAVSFFSIPLYVYLSTPAPGSGSNCGLSQTRSSIMSYLESVFSTVPPSPENAQWSNLVLHSGSTIYRSLSPGKAMAGGFFDINYLDNVGAYGFSYLNNIWTSPSSFYRTNTLSIKIPNGLTYSGTVQGDNTFLLKSGSNQVTFSAPVQGPPYTSSTTFNIFSGLPLYSSATSDADGVQVSKAFEEAIIAGIVPTTSLIDASTLYTLSSFKPYYQVNSNLTGLGTRTGPWYDLYSAALHACGLIYTFAYDEPLWPQVLLQSNTLETSTYIGITIGNTQ